MGSPFLILQVQFYLPLLGPGLLEEQSHLPGARNMEIVVRMADVRSLYPESERWAFGLSVAWKSTPEGEYSGKRP